MPKAEKKEKKEKPAKKEKVVKDPNAPKKNVAAYMFFCKATREEIKKEDDKLSFGEIGKILGARWKEADEKDKAEFIALAAKDKERYAKENAAYLKKKADAPAPAGAKSKKKAKADEEEADEEEADEEEADEDDE